MKFNPDYKSTLGKNQCVHGNLKRKCEICELEHENAELREVLKQIIEGAKRDSPMPSLEWHTLWKRAEALVAGNKGGKGK